LLVRLVRLPVLRRLRLLPFLRLLLVFLRRRFGTFAPDLRASERPIAIACLRLVTFLPERPLRSWPRLRSCIARSTFFDAFLPYFLAISAPSDNRVVRPKQHDPCQETTEKRLRPLNRFRRANMIGGPRSLTCSRRVS
jgi:hypothetical protein